ncbi:hypothetical protein [Bradyrhizobium algeriense]|nr:hypothetical protein [Bradyrhizobium algeriense]
MPEIAARTFENLAPEASVPPENPLSGVDLSAPETPAPSLDLNDNGP